MPVKQCACGKTVVAKGLCKSCYYKARRKASGSVAYGDPSRLWGRVEKTDGCWLWTGSVHIKMPYGRIKWAGKETTVHRLVWTLVCGPIPAGMHVLHKCDNPRCCRPEHLFLGTYLDNSRDKYAKGRQGSRLGVPKLTVEEVKGIRSDSRPYPLVAASFNVSERQVYRIKSKTSWKQVP